MSSQSGERILLFEKLSDEDLAAAAQTDEIAMQLLMNRMTPVVLARMSPYRHLSVDREDLMQEGLIGLVSAVRHYRSGNGSARFRTYAGVCIGNRITSYLKTLFRQKNLQLNASISWDQDAQDLIHHNILPRNVSENPEELLILQEELESLWNLSETSLSRFEYRVFQLYLSGLSYVEIGQKLAVSAKSVDNALQRIKRKMKQVVSNRMKNESFIFRNMPT